MAGIDGVNVTTTGFKSLKDKLRVTVRDLENKSKIAQKKVVKLVVGYFTKGPGTLQPKKFGVLERSLRVQHKWLKGGKKIRTKIYYYKRRETITYRTEAKKKLVTKRIEMKYAGYVHNNDNPDVNWTRSGSGAEWLTKAFQENKAEIMAIYKRYAKVGRK